MMTPFDAWLGNVEDHPESFTLGGYEWKDTTNRWKISVDGGILFYCLKAPEGGKIKLSFTEKLQIHQLIKWWAAGSLQSEGKKK